MCVPWHVVHVFSLQIRRQVLIGLKIDKIVRYWTGSLFIYYYTSMVAFHIDKNKSFIDMQMLKCLKWHA